MGKEEDVQFYGKGKDLVGHTTLSHTACRGFPTSQQKPNNLVIYPDLNAFSVRGK